MYDKKISISLLILRLSFAAFFGVWSSLKFFRPEWFAAVSEKFYGLDAVSASVTTIVGIVQILIVIAFALGFKRTLSYGALILMHATGVLSSIPNLMNFTQYPNNLMWAAVPALAAVVVLFVLREYDEYTVDGQRAKHA